MAENKDSGKSNNRKILIIAVIVLLVMINGIQLFLGYRNDQRNQAVLENKEMELRSTYVTLDSIAIQLNSKIRELDSLGVEVDSLIAIRDELERDKSELALARNLAQERYESIRSKVEAYEVLLKQKDMEIARLKEFNKELYDETITLKNKQNQLTDQLNSLKVEKNQLDDKVKAAGALKAGNLRVFAYNRNEKEKEGPDFRVKQLEKLKVTFRLEENSLAEIGPKKIMMRIIEPEGSALYNVASGSGEFNFRGESIFYTAMQEILFDNSQQLVTFIYEKGNDYSKGRYKVELYCEGTMIGKADFLVN